MYIFYHLQLLKYIFTFMHLARMHKYIWAVGRTDGQKDRQTDGYQQLLIKNVSKYIYANAVWEMNLINGMFCYNGIQCGYVFVLQTEEVKVQSTKKVQTALKHQKEQSTINGAIPIRSSHHRCSVFRRK